jgi:hypothetical protein
MIYISRAMEYTARSMAANMAGNASAPFLRRRTVVIRETQNAKCTLQNAK